MSHEQDIDLITRYLTRESSAEERIAVEERLMADHDFYMYVSPLIKLWQEPADWRVLPRESNAPSERPETSAANDPYVIGTIEPKRVREPAVAYALGPQEQQPVIESRQKPEQKQEEQHEQEQAKVNDPWEARLMDFFMEGGWTMTKIAAAIWMFVAMPLMYYVRFAETPHPTVTVVQQSVPATVIPGSTLVEAKAGEERAFTLPGGSRAVLRPGSRFWYKTMAIVGGSTATLQGELALEITRDDKRMLLNTSVGKVMLMPGSYAVRCTASCAAMLVTVGASGFAFITAPDSAKGPATILRNEHGALKENGGPEKITGGNDPLEGWPKLIAPAAAAKQ